MGFRGRAVAAATVLSALAVFGGSGVRGAHLSGGQEPFADISPDSHDLPPNGASGGRVNGVDIAPDGTTFYAASEFGGVFKSSDGGATWSRLVRHLPKATWDIAVDPSDPNIVYATSLYDGRKVSRSGIQVSRNAGASWGKPATAKAPLTFNCPAVRRDEPAAYGIAVHPGLPSSVYVGTSCGLAISTDSGVTWTFRDPTPASPASDVWDVEAHLGSSGQLILDVCGDDRVLRSIDGGATWVQSASGPNPGRCSIAVSPHEPNVLFVISDATRVFESDDGGVTWAELGTAPSIAGRVPFVITNARSETTFDLWYADRELFRASCTSGGPGRRCPPPASWVNSTSGAHFDAGDLEFAPGGPSACPRLFSSDGGVHVNTVATSPDCHAPVWARSNVGLHALLLTAMAGLSRPFSAEHVYFGTHDNGLFGSSNVTATTPTWKSPACCDVYDVATDGSLVLQSFCCSAGRGSSLLLKDLALSTSIALGDDNYPPSGRFNAGGIKAIDVIDSFGPSSFVVITRDCTTPPDGIDNNGNGSIDEVEETRGCRGLDGGVFVTSNINAHDVVWTELGNGTEPPSDSQVCGVKGSQTVVKHATFPVVLPVFYVQVGPQPNCNGNTGEQLWRYVGTGANGTWTRIDDTLGRGGIGMWDVDPNDADRLYASWLLPPGHMVSSTDGGDTWAVDTDLDALMKDDGDYAFLHSRSASISGFSGESSEPSFVAYDPEDPNIVAAGGMHSGLFVSSDAGANWAQVDDEEAKFAPHISRPRFVHFDHEPSGSTTLYVGSEGMGVWRIPLPTTDVALSSNGLSSRPAEVPAGTTLRYELLTDNTGIDAAGNPRLRIDLPEHTTLKNVFAPDDWACFIDTDEADVVRCTADSLASAGSERFLLSVRVNTDAPAGSALIGGASVASNAVETDTVDNAVSLPPYIVR